MKSNLSQSWIINFHKDWKFNFHSESWVSTFIANESWKTLQKITRLEYNSEPHIKSTGDVRNILSVYSGGVSLLSTRRTPKGINLWGKSRIWFLTKAVKCLVNKSYQRRPSKQQKLSVFLLSSALYHSVNIWLLRRFEVWQNWLKSIWGAFLKIAVSCPLNTGKIQLDFT